MGTAPIVSLDPYWKDSKGRCYTPSAYIYDGVRRLTINASFDLDDEYKWEEKYDTYYGFLGVPLQ